MKNASLGGFLFVVTFALSGCISPPVNQYTARRYIEEAQKAENEDDLELARSDYARAYGNTEAGNLSPEVQAHALYEYARLSAYLGDRAEAEKGFIRVLELIAQAGGRANSLQSPCLVEYARMLRDQGEHANAVPIYERALAALEKLNLDERSPANFTLVLADAAENARDANRTALADALQARAATLRQNHPADKPTLRTWKSYASAGRFFEAKNNWLAARTSWARAIKEAESIHPSSEVLVPLYYEYGRSLGVTGLFSTAEAYLQKARALDRQTNGPVYMDLTELARINFDQAKFPEAIVYFEQDISELDRAQMKELAPAEYIEILSEYSVALRKVGRESEALAVDARIKIIRERHPSLHSNTDRTPYGKFLHP